MATRTAEKAAGPPGWPAEARRAEDPRPLFDALEAQLNDALKRSDALTADTVLRAIREERQHEQARVQYEQASQREREALDEIVRHLATARAGVSAVRQSLGAAVRAEQAAGNARRDAHAALVALGEQPQDAATAAPTIATAVIDRDPVLRGIYRSISASDAPRNGGV